MDRERTANGEIGDEAAAPAGPPEQGVEAPEQSVEAPEQSVEAPEQSVEAPEQSVEALRAEVARLTAETERNWQQFLRTAAEMENFRKQAARQRDEAVASTRRALLAVILGVVDTLERALAHAGAGQGEAGPAEGNAAAIAEGIRLARRQVLDVLSRMGVRPMEAVGQAFDPRVHDAVEVVAAEEGAEAGTVVAEVQRGYLLDDQVLRPARVRVAQ